MYHSKMAQTGMMNRSNADGIFSNISNHNASCCPDGMAQSLPASNVLTFRFSLAFAIICCVNIAMAFASVFVNSLLLWAITRVENSVLKAKRFIINLSITNIALPVLFALDPYFISSLLYKNGNIVSPDICALGVVVTLGLVLFCTQASCVLGLACDRIYAVARPLTYSTIGYTQPMSRFMLFLPWLIGTTIWVIFMLVSWPSLPPAEIPGVPTFCLHLVNTYLSAEGTKTLDSFIGGVNIFSFIVYVSIFGILKYKERTIQNLSKTTAKKTTLSLARTYFLINITTLALYLPAPLFSIIAENATGDSLTEESAYIASSLIILYLGNTCLDPLILMSRIPSIRRHLPIKSKSNEGQHDRKHLDSTTVTQRKTVSTLSV